MSSRLPHGLILPPGHELLRPLSGLGAPGVAEAHNSDTDALLLACGDWTKDLHDEIEIFDDSQWKKSKEPHTSVRGSSWDDVILDPAMKENLIRDVVLVLRQSGPLQGAERPVEARRHPARRPGQRQDALDQGPHQLARRAARSPFRPCTSRLSTRSTGPKWCIKNVFEHARKMSPCLLIFEDLDSMVEEKDAQLFPQRGRRARIQRGHPQDRVDQPSEPARSRDHEAPQPIRSQVRIQAAGRGRAGCVLPVLAQEVRRLDHGGLPGGALSLSRQAHGGLQLRLPQGAIRNDSARPGPWRGRGSRGELSPVATAPQTRWSWRRKRDW